MYPHQHYPVGNRDFEVSTKPEDEERSAVAGNENSTHEQGSLCNTEDSVRIWVNRN